MGIRKNVPNANPMTRQTNKTIQLELNQSEKITVPRKIEKDAKLQLSFCGSVVGGRDTN